LTSRPALTAAPGSTREKDHRIPQSLQFGMSGALDWGKAAMRVRFSVCVLTAIIAMGQLPIREQRESCLREKPANWGAIRSPIPSIAAGCIDRWFAAYFRECALRFTREKAKVRSREDSKWNIVCRESQFGKLVEEEERASINWRAILKAGLSGWLTAARWQSRSENFK